MGGEISNTINIQNSNAHVGVGKKAMSRLLGIVQMTGQEAEWDHVDEAMYGIGEKRDIEQFFTLFGIDRKKRVADDRLCLFVSSGNMHRNFHDAHLRRDGMGIDYNAIGDYKIPALNN